MSLRRLFRLRRYPRCARVAAGYRCHDFLPQGCEFCGRGSPRKTRKYFRGYFGTVKEAEGAYIKLINELDKGDK